MRHVLIAGAGGLVGAHLVTAFRAGAWTVTPTARRPGTAERALDITDEASVGCLLAAQPVDVLVCAAAEASVEGCERDTQGTRRTNVDAQLRLARQLADRGARLVVFSSEYVFDGRQQTPYREDDAVAPLNEYGRQKVELERGVCVHSGHLVVRTSGIYGSEARRKNFVFQLLDHAARNARLPVANDQLITPTWARNLDELTVRAVEREVTGVLHLAGGEVMARDGIARLICDVFGLDPRVVEAVPSARMGLAAVRPPSAGLGVDLARRLGLGPLVGPREGLRALREELLRAQGSPA